MKLHLISLGCNKNLVDSEIMLGRLRQYALTDDATQADAIIVNTCGFIRSAKEESIRTILELSKAKKDNAVLCVTGCLMQRYKEELMKELPEVDVFSGVGDYDKIDEILLSRHSRFSPQTYLTQGATRVITGSSYHAFVKISEGCNQHCSFCAIPTFKGKLKSRSIDNIVQELTALVAQGFSDFSFLAQDSSSFGFDTDDQNLIKLIDAVEKVKGVKRARILYLYPTSTTFELIKRIENSSVFVNYFDMPIQHISDKMLKIMRRGSGSQKLKELLGAMREVKGSFLRTGVIVGHPGEEEADFAELCDFLTKFEFDRISAFAYSREEDTAAYEMPQVKNATVTKRLTAAEKIINTAIHTSFSKLVGKTVRVVINGSSSEGEMFFGAKCVEWDRDIDGEILVNDSEVKELQVGGEYDCFISEFSGEKLIGQILG